MKKQNPSLLMCCLWWSVLRHSKEIGDTIIWKFLNFFSEKLVEAVIMFVKCDCVLSLYKIISLYRPQVFVCVREWKNDKAVIMPTKIMSFVVLMENCGNAKSSRGGEVGTGSLTATGHGWCFQKTSCQSEFKNMIGQFRFLKKPS